MSQESYSNSFPAAQILWKRYGRLSRTSDMSSAPKCPGTTTDPNGTCRPLRLCQKTSTAIPPTERTPQSIRKVTCEGELTSLNTARSQDRYKTIKLKWKFCTQTCARDLARYRQFSADVADIIFTLTAQSNRSRQTSSQNCFNVVAPVEWNGSRMWSLCIYFLGLFVRQARTAADFRLSLWDDTEPVVLGSETEFPPGTEIPMRSCSGEPIVVYFFENTFNGAEPRTAIRR